MTVHLRDTRLDTIKSAMTFAAMGGVSPEARSWAVNRWGEAGAPGLINKADVGSVVSGDMDTSSTGLADRAMFSAIREKAVLYRLRGFRRTGFNIRSILTGGATASWVAPGQPIPVSAVSIDNTGLDPFKLAGMAIATETAVQAAPGLEESLFNDLAQAFTNELDDAFLDPANAGSAGVKPASITNGVAAVPATSDPAADLGSLVASFEGNLASAYFALTPETAARLAGTGLFRDVGARGGELLGVPVLTARNAPVDSITLIDPTGIMAAFDNEVLLETGKEGAVEMSDAPTNNSTTPTASELVSLWQANLLSFRAIGRVAWTEARPGSVSVLQGGGSDWLA